MRTVENAHLPKQKYRDPTSSSLLNFSTKFNEQSLNIMPLDIGARWPGKNQVNSSLVFPLRAFMVPFLGTAIKRSDTRTSLVGS
jgi:hypothetical protein